MPLSSEGVVDRPSAWRLFSSFVALSKQGRLLGEAWLKPGFR
jgi:hypothetical protein